MRVVFWGNVDDYSLRFLEAIVARSVDSDDPVSLVAAVCPVARRTPREEMRFRIKKSLAGALPRRSTVLPGLAALNRRLSGVWRDMYDVAKPAGASVFWPNHPADPDLIEELKTLDADLCVVAGLDRILSDGVISSLPPLFNIHPSMLPEYRGALPDFWQLADGREEGGVTIHRIDPGLDTGPIVLQRSFPIEPWLDVRGYIVRSVEFGIALLNELLDGFPDTCSRAREQSGGSYQPIPKFADFIAPCEQPAEVVFNRSRARGYHCPLFIYVARADWESGASAIQGFRESGSDRILLELYEPITFPEVEAGTPYVVTRAPGDGVTLSCNPGVVFFRRAVESAQGGR